MSILLDGSNDWIDLGDSLDMLDNQGVVSFSFWFNLQSSMSNNDEVIALSIDSGGTLSKLAFHANGSSEWVITLRPDDSTFYQSTFTSSSIVTDTWQHIVVIADIAGDEVILYVDGSLIQTNSVSFSMSSFNGDGVGNGALCAGDSGGSPYTNAYLADFRVYQKKLSAQEAEHLYRMRGGDNLVDSLYHRWRLMDGSPGTTASSNIIDLGTGGLDITPNNSPSWQEDFLLSI